MTVEEFAMMIQSMISKHGIGKYKMPKYELQIDFGKKKVKIIYPLDDDERKGSGLLTDDW